MHFPLIAVLALACMMALPMKASEEYVFCFPPNFREHVASEFDKTDRSPQHLSLSLGTNAPAQIRIQIQALAFDTSFAVGERASVNVKLPKALTPKQTGLSSNSIVVTSSVPIGVTALSHRFQCTEAFSVSPVSQMGSAYVVASYTKLASDLTGLFSVVGIEDGTMIHVQGAVGCEDFDKELRKGIDVRIDRGQVWTYVAPYSSASSSDPTGAMITSTRPISVISGHSCAYVPAKVEACNPLYEQLLPISTFGTETFVPPLALRSGSNVRVIATAEGSIVTVNGETSSTLAPQNFTEISPNGEPLWVRSEGPVQVALYGRGFKDRDSIGDPCMIMVPSKEQFAREQMITTLSEPNWKHYVTVICPPGHTSEVTINGIVIEPSTFKHHYSGYRYTSVLSAPGSHLISSSKPVGLFVHGIGTGVYSYDAYGTSGAMVIRR